MFQSYSNYYCYLTLESFFNLQICNHVLLEDDSYFNMFCLHFIVINLQSCNMNYRKLSYKFEERKGTFKYHMTFFLKQF